MRSLWAVACAASVSGLLLFFAGGCAGTKSQVKEFNRMEIGEGPREVLSQMIELQKEPGGQRVEAHPVLVSPGEGTDIPSFYSSDFPSGNLSMSRATGAMHDVQPAVPPLGNPPLLVQTDVQNEKSSPGDPVPPASVAPRYSPSATPARKVPPPVVASAKSPPATPPEKTPARVTASVEPPAPVLSKKEPAPVTTTIHLPLPANPKNTPAPVAESIEPPVAAPPEKEPATVIASVKPPAPEKSATLSDGPSRPSRTMEHARAAAPAPPKNTPAPAIAPAKPPVSAESIPTPVPPVPHQMTLKKETAFQPVSRKTPPSFPTPPPSAQEKKKTRATDFTGGPNYRIGPEDVLHIDVWGNEELTRDVTVRPDGKISLPLIQDIQAEGLTAAQLSDGIHQKLLAFIKGPEVAVIVTEVNAPKVFVIGNVTRPGPYPLRGDISVLQALSLAGGFTPFASPKNIKVISNKEGKREVYKVNYYDIIGKGREGDYFLKPGDTIVVP